MSKLVNATPLVGICPACDTKLRFVEQLRLGEFVICAECGAELEVVELTPLKLDWAFEEPFDDYDYEEFDDLEWEEEDDDYDDDYDDDDSEY